MELSFSKCLQPLEFFRILPPDWQGNIVPFWSSFKDSSTIYVLKEHSKIVAGGILFSKLPPNPTLLDRSYAPLLEKGYLYIGFLYVLPEMRLHHLGSEWLTRLKNKNPKQGFWLSIEEDSLKEFYQKNGFSIAGESHSEPREWVLTYG